MAEKSATFKQRRAADTARWRERLQRGAAVYPVEGDGTTFDLMERFGGVSGRKTGDRQAVAGSHRPLLRRALEALPREEAASGRSLWRLNRLSSDRPRRLMGVLAFKLPCGRCQL